MMADKTPDDSSGSSEDEGSETPKNFSASPLEVYHVRVRPLAPHASSLSEQPPRPHHHHHTNNSTLHETLKTVAGIAGNILEWYDFAVFGFFSDVLAKMFFPSSTSEDLGVMESFAVFGGAFLMRPVGGIIIGYIGDVSGRKRALEISIFLMAIATTCMGCLPTYEQIGGGAILLLLMVRMLQGLSVGGQLMSSLVFTVEGHPRHRWGLYGSCVMAAGNFGTFLGGAVAFGLRSSLTDQQLYQWGWRIPFLSGILISICGIYLKYYCQDDEILPGHAPVPTVEQIEGDHDVLAEDSIDEFHKTTTTMTPSKEDDDDDDDDEHHADSLNARPWEGATGNPLRLAFSRENRRSLFATVMVPMVWSGGFYLSFVWMAIYMQDMIQPPIPSAFAINSGSLLLLCVFFPVAGGLSDHVGRKRVMTIGGVAFGALGPLMIFRIGRAGSGSEDKHNGWIPVFVCQTVLSVSLACWGAPMCAWLVEAFEPKARLTSVSIGYNVAQAIAGGMSPFLATLLVDEIGSGAPGILLVTLSLVSLLGLWFVAPPSPSETPTTERLTPEGGDDSIMSLELREIT